MSTSSIHSGAAGCQICLSKNQQILAKDEVIRAKDAVIAAKDDAIAQKDMALKAERELREQLQKQLKLASAGGTKIKFLPPTPLICKMKSCTCPNMDVRA